MEMKAIITIAILVTALALAAFGLWRETRRARRTRTLGIDSYGALPLGIYREILQLAENKDPEDAWPEIVAKVSGRSLEEVMALTLPEYAALAGSYAWLQDDPKPVAVRRLYDCGPFVLRLPKDVTALTASQYIDAQTLLEDPADRLPELLAIVLVPEGHIYGSGYEMEDVRAAILEHLSILDAVAIRDFFADCSRRLTRRFLTSSGKMMKMQQMRMKRNPEKLAQVEETLTMLTKMEEDLEKNGAGSRASTTSLSLPVALGMLHLKCL